MLWLQQLGRGSIQALVACLFAVYCAAGGLHSLLIANKHLLFPEVKRRLLAEWQRVVVLATADEDVNGCVYVILCMRVCVCMHVCMYACVCMHACMYVCMYVCVYECIAEIRRLCRPRQGDGLLYSVPN